MLRGGFGDVGGDDQVGDAAGDVAALLVAGDLARDVGTFHDEAHLAGHLARVGCAGAFGQIVNDLLDGLLVLGGGNVGRFVKEGKFHGDVDEDAALECLVGDDLVHDIQN